MTWTTSGARPGRAGRRLLVAGAVVAGLLSPVSAARAAEPSAADFRAMGRTSAPNYRLPPGCHRYSYAYRISPPEPEWNLEVFITDAAGVAQASSIITAGADRTAGRRWFQLCESNTAAPGRFTIRARLSYRHHATTPLLDHDQDYSGWIRTSHFRVTKSAAVSPRCRRARAEARRADTVEARRAAHRACLRR